MENKNALQITSQYPADRYNLLVPMQTVAEIAEIHKPVMNAVQISVKPEDKEIYLQERGSEGWVDNRGYTRDAKPEGWALTKKGLNKLMRAAGIKIIETHSVIPSTCQKCAEVNKSIGRATQCGSCANKDVKYEARISVPQLTGENIEFVAHKEILVEDAIVGMTDKQKKEFLKFRSEMCETKAINRALRAAMHIKGTYTIEELRKPFVVAYLVPNLDNPEVKAEAIKSFFGATKELYGMTENTATAKRTVYIENEDEEEYAESQYIDQNTPYESDEPTPTEYQPQPQAQIQPRTQAQTQTRQQQSRPEAAQNVCSECGKKISEKVSAYSIKRYNKPLCMDCQNEYKNMGVR